MRINRFHIVPCLVAFFAVFMSGPAQSDGAPPKDDDKKAGVRFDVGSPRAEKNPNGGWKVTAKAMYRYDAGWELKEMKIQVYFVKKDDKDPKCAIEMSWPNEASIGIKGEVSATYTSRAPGDGESVMIKSIMIAKHPIFGEQEWSISSPVLPPAKK